MKGQVEMDNNENNYFDNSDKKVENAEGDVVYTPNYSNSVNGNAYTPKKKKERRMGFFKVLAVSLICSIITSTISAGLVAAVMFVWMPTKYMKKSDYVISTTLGDKEDNSSKDETSKVEGKYTVSEIADMVLPSVVAITSTSYINGGNNPFLDGYYYQATGAGSGIIIGQNEKELLIVTNDHVVEGTSELTIEFVDGSTCDAYIKGKRSNYDIAVVAVKIDDIKEETLTSIKIATLGDSDKMQVGDGVVAIGNALGYGQSVTDGIISALEREVTTDTYTMNMLQTNAAINGGNSGGALINMDGEVIGINAAKTSSNASSQASVEGMGYAIPITAVKDIIADLMNAETKEPLDEDEKGYLGVTVSELTAQYAKVYGIESGVIVAEVYEGSGAKAAGIYAGDVIIGINDVVITSVDSLSEELQYIRAGETVKIKIMANMGRGEFKEMVLDVELKSYNELYK